MPESEATRRAKTPEQVEDKLRNAVELRLLEFRAATDRNREAAKQRLIVA